MPKGVCVVRGIDVVEKLLLLGVLLAFICGRTKTLLVCGVVVVVLPLGGGLVWWVLSVIVVVVACR